MATGNVINNNSTGISVYNGSGTFTGRSIAVTASTGLSVSNADGTAGNPTLAGISATTSVLGVVQLATGSQTKTGTSTTLVPPVSALVQHQGVAKAWINYSSGTTTINNSYNVTSSTANGTGDNTINFTTSFANANYVAAGIGVTNNQVVTSLSTGSARITTGNIGVGNLILANGNPATLVFFGEQ